jgi:hypothetical protein
VTARRLPILHPGWVLAAACLVLHAFVNQRYGIFRDELYFIVCGRSPDWGYVDQPPLVPLIAAFCDRIAPGSLTVMRGLAAILAAGLVWATVGLTRTLGGRDFAQWTAGLATLLAPIALVWGFFLSTDIFLPLAWLACAALLIRMLNTGDYRGWLPFGIVVGFALWSKYLILFNLLALAVALPFSPLRRSLITPWPYLGALIALTIAAPNIAWQWQHGWPFLELGAAGANGKNVQLSLPAYLGAEIILLNAGAAVVWIAGLAATLFSPRWRLYRLFSLQWAALMLIEVALHGKDYYAASLYPPLFAIGAAAIENFVSAGAVRGAVVLLVVGIGLIGAPIAVPILPIDTFIAYERALGAKPPQEENRALADLPQTLADQFGWREMAKAVGDAYRGLPEADREKAVFLAWNYGEAAAIDVLGDGLPPAISGHNNYFLWGPRGHDGSVLIVLLRHPESASTHCGHIEVVGKIDTPYAMPDETGLAVAICRNDKTSLIADWPRFKNYN